MRSMRGLARLGDLRPVGVAYLWGVATSLAIFAFATTHPLGVIYEVITAIGAIALFALPTVESARIRAGVTGVTAFVILVQAVEWTRLVDWPVGPGVSVLWLTTLVGVIVSVSGDQDIGLAAKLDHPMDG